VCPSQGGAWGEKKVTQVSKLLSKYFFGRLWKHFAIFFNRVFELEIESLNSPCYTKRSAKSQRRDKQTIEQNNREPGEGKKNEGKKPSIFCDEVMAVMAFLNLESVATGGKAAEESSFKKLGPRQWGAKAGVQKLGPDVVN
jgi:hypothetical protein